MTGAVGHPDRRGLILPVMLVILMLLAMMGMAFSLATSAELGAASARANSLQARLCAEAGIESIRLLMNVSRSKTSLWWNNPELHGVQVYPLATEASVFDRGGLDTEEDEESVQQKSSIVWRFSIVAMDLDVADEDERPIRYGVQDEAGKLNINKASADQLTALFAAVVDPDLAVDELVDALIDWRDSDSSTRSAGAESDYYQQLSPPYSAANAPLKTVEELLLIKGFTAQVVYGEDYNRNGILDPGEDDGMATFPPDNGDGELNRGLLPYVTVYSEGWDRASDNARRIFIGAGAKGEELAEKLEDYLDSEVIEFLVAALAGGHKFTSPAELCGELEVGEETMSLAPEDALAAMDRLTTVPQLKATPALEPLLATPLPFVINVNTASPPVLACLALDSEQIEQVISGRAQLSDEEKISPAWLVNEGIMTPEELAGYTGSDPTKLHIVTQSWQFTVESMGHADHVGMVCRLQAVIDLSALIPQTKYFRDLTRLGPGWPVREQEERREISGTTQ